MVIDWGVTNTGIFEFYLFSHTGIQGTSCPTHYRVILNDVEDLDSNEKIQEITYYLSFEYAKTLTPVNGNTMLLCFEQCQHEYEVLLK